MQLDEPVRKELSNPRAQVLNGAPFEIVTSFEKLKFSDHNFSAYTVFSSLEAFFRFLFRQT